MSIENVEKICRFCLESKKTEANPLLAPCECKGSIEFVHLLCLNRWRFLNPERNKLICRLCNTNYILPFTDELESIPQASFFFTNLEYPIITSILLHYILAVAQFAIIKSHASIPYETIQFVIQGVQVVQITVRFRVINWSRYFRGWEFEHRWTLFIFHMLLLFTGLFGSTPFTLFLSYFVFPMYWKIHTQILQEINDEYIRQRE